MTEITRPVPECTEQDIGKLCVFWDSEEVYHYGILKLIKDDYYFNQKFSNCRHCRRLTKQEIEELI